MRILHLGKYYSPVRGGIERYTQGLAESSVARGHAVAVLVHQPGGQWRGAREVIGGVEVRRAGCLATPLYTPISPGFPLALARALREFRPQLLHLHLPNPSCFAALASPAARRLPWIVQWQADVPHDVPDWRLRAAYRFYRPFEQAVLRRAHAVIAASGAYRDASRALQPWLGKVRVVPLGIGPGNVPPPSMPSAADAGTAAAWPAGGGLRLLAVGRLTYYKGFDVLLRGLAQLAQARLLLVGQGECEAKLRALTETLGLQERVRFAGHLDDAALDAAYAGADVFVLPSLDRSESFGMVLLEAMRARLPVVTSAIPGSGVGEVVAAGETGLLVPPGDSRALAAAIERLQDAGLRETLGRAGRARWADRYTLTASAGAIEDIYRDALANDPSLA